MSDGVEDWHGQIQVFEFEVWQTIQTVTVLAESLYGKSE